MKTRIILAILLLTMLLCVACKKRDNSRPDPSVAEQVVTFAPLPSFKEVYEVLDQL